MCKPPNEPPGLRGVKYLSAVLALVVTLTQAGCLAPPKPHSWQTVSPQPSSEETVHWPELSTNLYVRVATNKLAEAVALLEQGSWTSLDPEKAASFAPEFRMPAAGGIQPYLVRGVSYSARPAWTSLRFDEASGRLLVRQATWDGEMLMPFRWVAQPNAFVTFLPRPPTTVYPDAWLGGDGIFRGRNLRAMDTR